MAPDELTRIEKLAQVIDDELRDLRQPAPISLLEHLSQLVSLELKAVRIEIGSHEKLDVERFSAQKELLAGTIAAQKENVAIAFTASEKALQRAEASHVEFRTQMEKQAAAALHSMEERVSVLSGAYEHTAELLRAEIANLRESRGSATGATEKSRWDIGTLIAIAAVVAALAALFIRGGALNR